MVTKRMEIKLRLWDFFLAAPRLLVTEEAQLHATENMKRSNIWTNGRFLVLYNLSACWKPWYGSLDWLGRVKNTSLANLKGSSETHLSRVLFLRIGFNNYLDLGIGISKCLFRFLVCCVAVLHAYLLLCVGPWKPNPSPTNERKLSRAGTQSNVHCHWFQLSWKKW